MEKGKHYKKKNYKVKKLRIKLKPRLFLNIILIISIICNISFINIISKLKKEHKEDLNNTVKVSNEIKVEKNNYDNKENEVVSKVKKLKEENKDVIGWIKINGTNIDYPVLQGEDNDYYVTHDYKKQLTKKGAIFLDKDYDWTIPSSNILLYGHNNKGDNEMFSELLKYKDEKFYKENPTVKFATTEEEAEYEIIAVFLSRVYYKNEENVFRYYYFVNAKNEEEYNDFVNNAKKASLYDTGKTAEYGEQLITLSTCEYSQEDGRFAIVARKK